MRVQVIRAWPRRFDTVVLELDAGVRVADALGVCGWAFDDGDGVAIFGERASLEQVLLDGDRVELLRPLRADPKDARRRRAARARGEGRTGPGIA